MCLAMMRITELGGLKSPSHRLLLLTHQKINLSPFLQRVNIAMQVFESSLFLPMQG